LEPRSCLMTLLLWRGDTHHISAFRALRPPSSVFIFDLEGLAARRAAEADHGMSSSFAERPNSATRAGCAAPVRWSGSREALLPPCPLGTERDSFPSFGSGIPGRLSRD